MGWCVLQGLAKLQKTQKDVDVLVEEAKIKAVEVEKKVAGADAFAEQVSILNSLNWICCLFAFLALCLLTYASGFVSQGAEANSQPFNASHRSCSSPSDCLK